MENPGSTSRRKWLWPLVVAATIFYASSRSSVAAPPVAHVDKYGHFLVYGLLATLLCRLGRGWRAAAWAVLTASVYGATDEWHQFYVPGRSSDVFDWIADTSGAALAAALYAGWGFYRRLLERSLGSARKGEDEGGVGAGPGATTPSRAG